MIWLLLLINLLVIIIEVPSLVKGRMHRELVAFAIVFAIGLYFSLAYYYEWPLKEPFNALMTYQQITGE